jgi:phosphatidylinositol alpha-1,6-mannosyltransferase
MQKNILVLTENFPPKSGGSGRWFYELYTRLLDYQITVVTDINADSDEFDRTATVKIIRIPFSSTQWGFKSLIGLRFYFRCFWQLKQIIKEHQIDEVHCCRVIHEGVNAWLIKLFIGVPFVVFVHGEDVETVATSREQDLMVKQVCKSAKQIICNSHNTASIVARHKYAPLSATQVLHPGANTQHFVPANRTEEAKKNLEWQGKFIVLTVGRLQERKGHDKMILALPELISAIPNVLYAIIGDGECKPQLQELVERLELEQFVLFMDEVDDEMMIQCYQQADVFILPNRTIANDIEGFGMVLVESQACGTVVIAGDSGGTKETMISDETGFIIDCTQPNIIAHTILELHTDAKMRISMGQAGREFVSSTYDWVPHVAKANELFRV